ncbi:MAG: ROK family protein [Roseofilum sp. SBFL]|uniref:ROK family protein n=1 Tax=unclassified Roseofilum TaxID=2620099 RepID=UPI001B230523|nr:MULTISPECIES: ROK family protein [unclassified Roseofilum]MBP0011892.1 ROK family protein [Roseofilum sp. SID3]MBP0022448.1 ROK family protein [Roseofilum sp. SID2]MBP0037390.1 ROK family protein [Roseofilum sp. SID1]MBP0044822.1 ROK family protein [Roseofilum sp. SBFL]
MNQPTVIGIDIGGTGIKLGRFTQDGSCQNTLTIATPQPATPEAVLTALLPTLAELDPEQTALALGVGVPGPVDGSGKIARIAINLCDWQDVPLASWLESKTGKPTVLANDANCAGLGESWIGAGRNFQDLILLTLGTGVGGAIIINGKLFTGRHGAAGELGLITIDLYGHPCNSGNRGSLEQQVSIPAIRRQGHLEPQELGHLAESGNRQALDFWENYGHRLGAGIANLIYILTPEAVILGGGISQSAPYFLPATLAEIEQRVLPTSREGLQVLVAELGNQAGMVGAAKLAWQHYTALCAGE